MPASALGAALEFGTGAISSVWRGRAERSHARRMMRFQREEREASQAWQEQMSSTAHQRQMADMRAAGLNPMLAAFHGGASHGMTGMGQGAMPGPVPDPVQSALMVREQAQQLRNMRSQERLTREQGRGSEALADREEAQNRALGFQRRPDGSIVIDFSMPNITDLVQADLDHLRSQASLAKATARQTLANAKLLEHQEPEARLQRRITESPFGVWSAYGTRLSGAIPRVVPRLDMPLFRRR